jgi:hypothetical protein
VTAEVHAFEQDLRDVRVLRLLDAEWLDSIEGRLASRRRSARSALAAASSRPKSGTWGPKDNVHRTVGAHHAFRFMCSIDASCSSLKPTRRRMLRMKSVLATV